MTIQPPVQLPTWNFRQVAWGTLVLVIIAIGFWLLYRFYEVTFTLFITIVMGTVIKPIVNWLHRKGLPRIAGVLFVYLLLLILFIGFILLLFPLIIVQGTTIATAVPGYYQAFREWLNNYPNLLVVRLSGFLPIILPGLETTREQTGPEVMATAGQALTYAAPVVKAFFLIIIIFVLAFYWTLDGSRTIKAFLFLLPQEKREGVNELISSMETKVGLYISGQGVLCLVIGIVSLAAYTLIGLPNALVLALLAGILEAVPMIGPLLGAIPAAIVALSVGPDKLVWVIIATLIIQQVENSFLVPRVMSKAVGVNPFVSLLTFFAFSTLLGFGGALMAIPMAAILQLILDRFVFQQVATEAEGSTGRDYISRLRYEAQDLAQDLRKQARLKKGGSDKKVKQIDHILDEIETITTDLDSLLAQAGNSGQE
ncbi:MAG: AI-2E family transporter [Chloroflexota bacterium]